MRFPEAALTLPSAPTSRWKDVIAGASIVAGALVAAWLLPRLGFSVGPTLIRNIINATIGAAIVMAVLAVIRRG